MESESDFQGNQHIKNICLHLRQLSELEQWYITEKAEIVELLTNAIRLFAAEIIAKENDKLRVRFIQYLYWSTPISVELIAEVFQEKSHRIHLIAGPVPSSKRCEICNTAIPRKSRSDDLRFDRLCKKCNVEKERARSETSHKQEEKRTKRRQLLRSMPYREYLQTEEWQAKRQEALRRAKYHCQLCNQQDALDVHHRTYENRGEEYVYKDLIVLCRTCHEKFHEEVENGKAK